MLFGTKSAKSQGIAPQAQGAAALVRVGATRGDYYDIPPSGLWSVVKTRKKREFLNKNN